MKQYRVKRRWVEGKQGPNGIIIEMNVRELDTTQDACEWLDRSEKNSTFSVETEETINRVIRAYGLVHKQSIDGWTNFVRDLG